MPSNSVFVLGWETNKLFTHEVKADKRHAILKRPDELLCDEQRISLTFRSIATYITPTGAVFGQGATRKVPLMNGPEDGTVASPAGNNDRSDTPGTAMDESQRLLAAFGVENRSALYDWDELYGTGFDIVNFSILNTLSD